MKTPRISARALIVKHNAVLVIEYKDEAGIWYTLPGGGQQYGEDLITCVRREILEETGLHITVGEVRFVREFIADDQHRVSIIFECDVERDRTSSSPTNPDPGQIGWKWLEFDQLATSRFYPRPIAQALLTTDDKLIYLGDVN
ncbi:NUDIX domain-containing protein [Kovacikia minuta CCNUW1]|uniref:NUDIX domain-containing protein n=1 Tax=Kovacikia minuta TaxID=2931930 RepID=UPI001CC9B87F|nr:NUDIX domain-containing protein [Kovacikia minuta]UBF26046.1 NUDIX domain-containing protein [Kovacikia minuta CCNUW1]